MIPGAELISMRATQALALPSLGTILDRGAAQDALGGQRQSWTPRAVPVRCRVGAMSDQAEAIAADQLNGRAGVVITLEHGTPIDAGDRITVDGATYSILTTETGESWDTAVRCGAVAV